MADSVLHCLVEIPKGSRNKYEWDEQLQAMRFDRFLFSSVVYPLDAMVAVSEPTFPGCMIPVNPIALFKMRDEKGVDDKVVCVPLADPNWQGIEELEDLPPQLRAEISNFFDVYKTLEPGKDVTVEGWFSRSDAMIALDEAQRRFAELG